MNDQTERPDRRIVVGVDGSTHSKTALRWAIAQARLAGATVEAVSAWHDPALVGYAFSGIPVMYEGDSIATITEKVLAETVADVAGQQDQPVEVRTCVVQGHPAQVLLEAATGADMLVLGSRGHGAFAGMLLGSVSQHCVQHASCPVLVVPQHSESSE
ncbi:universal stress protein [Dactylosporangium cerinum]|uniref:Universal stress protein n=1 Tax=Dactylosporangium cerinum TaxID=1434730 RepID=A0ABV9WGF9_9ACTN